jgi:cyclopropane-fatty-acyl-phospholipid synthase
MNAPEQTQGHRSHAQPTREHVSGDFFLGPLFSNIAAARLHKLLDRMDAGLAAGSVQGSLPDGSHRILGGRAPGAQAEMNIRDWRALARIAWSGSIGLYQGWAKGEWDSPEPSKIFELFVANRVTLGNAARPSPAMRALGRGLHWMRRNSKSGSRRNIEFHYDLGNDFYTAWLDETMTYSSALFAGDGAEPLAEAQRRKNASLLERLHLKDGDSLLEIGCGWGGLAEAALQRHSQLRYHGITLSHEQKAYAQRRLTEFADNAAVTITDYRDVSGQYDAIASVEMVEAVGQEYWPAYLDTIRDNLKPGGRAAIQYIRIEDDIFDAYAANVDFIQRYIFPGGMLLSESRFRGLAEERGLIWQDQHDFGLHYAETLHQWRVSFEDAAKESRLPQGFDEGFVQLWRFYLMYCEGGFRGGGINVAQVTLKKV